MLGPGMGWNLPEQLGLQADAIGEQQLKRTQLNRGPAAEADAIRDAAAEADSIGDQQLKRTHSGSSS